MLINYVASCSAFTLLIKVSPKNKIRPVFYCINKLQATKNTKIDYVEGIIFSGMHF